MKLSVVIPVYNEKNTIEKIIKRVLAVSDLELELIVVDDASQDGTTNILKTLQKTYPQIKFIFQQVNQGKGAALRTGFKATTGDYIVVQDADMEYDPQDFHKLLKASPTKDKVIYGSRFLGNVKNMTGAHLYGNRFLTAVTNLLFGTQLTDMETCYKLMPGDFVRKLDIKSRRFNFEPEITAKILKSGLTIFEVPISYQGRSFSEGKKITWKDGFSAIATLVRFRFLV